MLPVPPCIWYRKKLQVVRKKELYISEKNYNSFSLSFYSFLQFIVLFQLQPHKIFFQLLKTGILFIVRFFSISIAVQYMY